MVRRAKPTSTVSQGGACSESGSDRAPSRASRWPGRGVSWGDEVELCADSLYLMITGKRPEELFETLGSTTAAVDA